MIQQVRENDFKAEYGILCRRIYPRTEMPTPFGSTWCMVEPLGSTLPHRHHEGETFFIVEGRGQMTVGGRTSLVEKGDIVYIPAFDDHVLRNTSAEQKLVFLSMWWEDAAAEVHRPRPERALITVAPPTPNGDLHLGHLSGPYTASDVYARYRRMQGVAVSFVSGSDDNQSYVEVKGRKLGLSAQETADRFAAKNLDTLKRQEIALDDFLRPTRTPEYIAFVRDFFRRLVDKKQIVAREAASLYCEACHAFRHEAYARGLCPHCGEVTNANGCEKCGFFNDGTELADPRCNQCDHPLTLREKRRFFFDLPAYADRLARYHQTVSMSARLRAYTHELLRRGLPEISASYVADWGIRVPIEGFEDQVIYEWLEMAAGYLYLAARRSPDGRWESFWKSGEAEVAQFFGFDNSFFYTSFLPALLLAYDDEIRLPRAFLSNEFYRLDGLKFSTSRNHAIWGDEILAEIPADVLRFHLARTRPETVQTNFTLASFRETIERELVGEWESWLAALDGKLAALDFVLPEARLLTVEQREFQRTLQRLVTLLEAAYGTEGFSLVSASQALVSLVREARRFGADQDFLKETPACLPLWRASVGWEISALKTLALVAAPLLPTLSRAWLDALGEASPDSPRWAALTSPLPAGRRIGRVGTRIFSEALAAARKLEAKQNAN